MTTKDIEEWRSLWADFTNHIRTNDEVESFFIDKINKAYKAGSMATKESILKDIKKMDIDNYHLNESEIIDNLSVVHNDWL